MSSRPRRIMLTLLAAAAIWTVYELIWVATGSPAPAVDHAAVLQDRLARFQGEGANAWPAAAEAADIAAAVTEEIRKEAGVVYGSGRSPPDWGFVLSHEISDAEMHWELEALERLRERGVYDRLAEVAAARRIIRPLDGESPLLAVQLPHLSRLRNLARARVASMRFATAAGEHAETVAAFEQSLALARAVGSQSFLVDRLVAAAIIELSLSEIRHQLLEIDLDAATARALLAAMDRQLRLPPMEHAVEAERHMALDTVDWVFTDDGHGDGRVDPARFSRFQGWATMSGSMPVVDWLGASIQAGRTETTALINEFYDGMVADARLDARQRLQSGYDVGGFQSGLGLRHHLVKALLPGLSRVLGRWDQTTMRIAGTRVMIALEIHRAEHGAYPESLDELSPSILPAAPPDPTHGGGFGYRRLETRDAGVPYLLYSTGVDGVDDLAAEIADHRGALEDLGAGGDDEVLNVPRPLITGG